MTLQSHQAFLLGAAEAQERLAVSLEREGRFSHADRAWARANAIRARADAARYRMERRGTSDAATRRP